MLPRLLTIMGSGETSPTMAPEHRRSFERLGPDAEGAVLDTPYGFQENAAEISERTVRYFRESVGRRMRVASFRADGGPLETEQALEVLRRSAYVFSGPGSPTHALRHWKGSPVPEVLGEKLREGGAVTLASAAALTLGEFTIPVYEIYKVGEDPHWVEGLDLLGELGLRAAVVPHYDNAEGGTHDTRYCYLGEERLRVMEDQLPGDAFVLGVDEHTACTLDLGAGELVVEGRGGVTVRRRGREREVGPGERITLVELRAGELPTGSARPPRSPQRPEPGPFEEEVRGLGRRFEEAMEGRRAEGAVEAVLELEGLVEAWRSDPTETDAPERARGLLRSMVVRLGEAAATGLGRPEEIGALVETILEAREAARREERWEDADALRERLVDLGVEVRDTPEGTTWELGPGHPDRGSGPDEWGNRGAGTGVP